MRRLTAQPLTAAAFAPFGDVISVDGRLGKDANQGTAQRFDFCAKFATSRPGAKHNLAVFRAQPRALPLKVELVERHPCSSQAFLPLSVSRYLVCVAPNLPDGKPDLQGLKAFVVPGTVGINYHQGTWHHPMVALDRESDFAMLAWEDGSPSDCELHPLDGSLVVFER